MLKKSLGTLRRRSVAIVVVHGGLSGLVWDLRKSIKSQTKTLSYCCCCLLHCLDGAATFSLQGPRLAAVHKISDSFFDSSHYALYLLFVYFCTCTFFLHVALPEISTTLPQTADSR